MTASPILQIRSLTKTFPGVKALDGVGLEVGAGTVHALLGENGAGKSTLVKTLLGIHRPDSGEILFKGRPVRLRDPHDALRLGIAMVHQELSPFLEMTVAENIGIGREPTRGLPGWVDKAALARQARQLLGRLGIELSPTRKMKTLSVAEMQLVEIGKALAWRAGLIVMDEPTSALSAREVEALFGVVRDLRRSGVAVIYISHKLDEVFALADAATVLRDGRHVATRPIGQLDERTLITMMVGREITAECGMRNGESQISNFKSQISDEIALAVCGLTKRGKFRDVSFQVRRGEILAIAGLMGAGRTELVSAIYGLAPAGRGEIRIGGRLVRIASPADAIAHGIAMVGEDRKRTGLVPRLSVRENITLAALSRCCRGPLINHRAERALAEENIRAFGIRARGPRQAAGTLSGGNQQKVVIARALLTDPQVLILDEPTRGIDIGAKEEVYSIIRALAREGRAVVMVSSELPEILALADRILVMREGAIAAELDPRHTTQEEVLSHAMPG